METRQLVDTAIANKFLVSLELPLWISENAASPPAGPVLAIDGREPKIWRQPTWRSPRLTLGFKGLTKPEPGFQEWVCEFLLRYPSVANEEAITITYTQPLRQMKAMAQFHYVPIFHAIPSEVSTLDTNKYLITLVAAPDCSFTATNGQMSYHVTAGGRITLSPEHLVPIQAVVRRSMATPPARVSSN